MSEIRYWQKNNLNTLENTLKDAKTPEKEVKEGNFRAFEATMLDSLMSSVSFGSDSSNIMSSFSSDPSASALFGNLGGNSNNLEDRLQNIQDQGMGKVLAAQFSNRLPNFTQSGSNDSSKNDLGGLNDMIALTMQSQMIKARKVLETQFEQFKTNDIDTENQSIAQFVSDIQSQIKSASDNFNISEEEVRRLL